MADNITLKIEEFTHRSFGMNLSFAIVTMLVAVVGIGGNLATMIAIVTTEELKLYLPNIFTFFLGVTDLMTSLIVIPLSAIAMGNDGWPFGQAMCNFFQIVNYFCIVNTTQLMALISADRAFSITWPFHYPEKATRNRLLLSVGITGFASCCTSVIPTLMGVNEYDYWEATCGVPWAAGTLMSYLYAYVNYVIFIISPQVVIMVSTGVIIRQVRKSKSNIKTVKEGDKSEDKKDAKLLKSLIILIGAYAATIGVWAGLRIIKATYPPFEVRPPWINTLTTPLLYMGSAVNPFIYAILRKDFRNAFKRLFIGFKTRISPL